MGYLKLFNWSQWNLCNIANKLKIKYLDVILWFFIIQHTLVIHSDFFLQIVIHLWKHDSIFGDGLWNKLSVHGTANISLITSIFEINNFHYIYWKHEEDVTISFINFLVMLYFHLLLFLLHVNEQFLLFF